MSDPYILLFHQAEWSRGEYNEIAGRLTKMGYNCLAVDLRSGGEINYIQNETATRAEKNGYSNSMLDAEKDIKAAIDYAYERTGEKVVLFGSSYSASLSLKVAKGNDKVHSVIAFSPGEFFKPQLVIQDAVRGLNKPVFAAGTQDEYQYVSDLLLDVSPELKTVFKPKSGEGEHGAKALWPDSNASNEYWFALMDFVRRTQQ
jgi:dienelactone hydrolase